jgi:hypothetical protein
MLKKLSCFPVCNVNPTGSPSRIFFILFYYEPFYPQSPASFPSHDRLFLVFFLGLCIHISGIPFAVRTSSGLLLVYGRPLIKLRLDLVKSKIFSTNSCSAL